MEGVDVPTRELPENPDLEHLKNQAKSLHRAVRAEDDDALAWFASSIPVTARWPQMPGGQHILAGRRVAGDSAPVRLYRLVKAAGASGTGQSVLPPTGLRARCSGGR